MNSTGFMKRPFSTRIRLLHNLMIQIFKFINTRTEIYAPEPVDGFTLGVLERAKSALRARGRKEAPLLNPLFKRLERRENPAQRARALLVTDGLDAVIANARIPGISE